MRSKLRSIGTGSAKRKLQELRVERDVSKGCDHNISNWIVSKPFDLIALEDLTHIRDGRRIRSLENGVSQTCEASSNTKAAAIGKKLVAIDPRYTSRTRSRCGSRRRKTVMVEPTNVKAVAFRSMQI